MIYCATKEGADVSEGIEPAPTNGSHPSVTQGGSAHGGPSPHDWGECTTWRTRGIDVAPTWQPRGTDVDDPDLPRGRSDGWGAAADGQLSRLGGSDARYPMVAGSGHLHGRAATRQRHSGMAGKRRRVSPTARRR